MKRLIRLILIIICAAWVGSALWMSGTRNRVIASGQKVCLEADEIDPGKVRGLQSLVLRLHINTLDTSRVKMDAGCRKGAVVFVRLVKRDEFWDAEEIAGAPRPGAAAVYMKARIVSCESGEIKLSYGIEDFYVPEAEEFAVTKLIRTGEKNAVSVEAAVPRDGNAVLSRLFINGQEVKFE